MLPADAQAKFPVAISKPLVHPTFPPSQLTAAALWPMMMTVITAAISPDANR
jgi:hypothetical protein